MCHPSGSLLAENIEKFLLENLMFSLIREKYPLGKSKNAHSFALLAPIGGKTERETMCAAAAVRQTVLAGPL
jgi:hypothetical protein